MAGPNCCAQAFFSRTGDGGGTLQASVGECRADLDQFVGELTQALAFGDFGAHRGGMAGRQRTGGLLAVGVEDEAEVGAVTGVARLLAMAVGTATLGLDFGHGTRAQRTDGADLG